jgi:hypothetical protein
MKIFDKAKDAFNNYQANQQAIKEAEEARRNKIWSGDIEPVDAGCQLEVGEKAYFVSNANRMALVSSIIEETKGKSKKKGVVGRAVVGGLLLGPLGALGGAATAGSRDNSKTIQKTVTSIQTIDNGRMIFTNKRIIFIGNNIISLPYNELLSTDFANISNGQKFTPKYQGMENGEFYNLNGKDSRDSNLYYEGITSHIAKIKK